MNWRWNFFELPLYFKQEHQPMGLPLVTVLADYSSEVQVTRLDYHADLFKRLSARASVRRFARGSVKFATARAPLTEVRFLRAFEKQNFVPLIETV